MSYPMLRYPVDVKRVSSDQCRAVWVDFPDLPRGLGANEQQAFNALIDNSFAMVADLVARGLHPEPSPAEGREVVTFDDVKKMSPLHLRHLLAVTPNGYRMLTYSWTNDLAYVE
jgi:hypothetical protein